MGTIWHQKHSKWQCSGNSKAKIGGIHVQVFGSLTKDYKGIEFKTIVLQNDPYLKHFTQGNRNLPSTPERFAANSQTSCSSDYFNNIIWIDPLCNDTRSLDHFIRFLFIFVPIVSYILHTCRILTLFTHLTLHLYTGLHGIFSYPWWCHLLVKAWISDFNFYSSVRPHLNLYIIIYSKIIILATSQPWY